MRYEGCSRGVRKLPHPVIIQELSGGAESSKRTLIKDAYGLGPELVAAVLRLSHECTARTVTKQLSRVR